MKDYLKPDFDVTIYEIEDVITLGSVGGNDSDPGRDPWYG